MKPIRQVTTGGIGVMLLMLSAFASAELPISGRIVKVSGTEALSTPYEFEVEVIGRAPKGPLAGIINEPASFALPGGRQVAGIVREVHNLGRALRGFRYQITLGPKMADLALVSRSGSLAELSSLDILRRILDEVGVDPQTDVTGTPTTLVHSTQLDESDLNYFHRIMEVDGLFYLFQHSASGASMRLADQLSGAPMLPQILQAGGRSPNLLALDFGVAGVGTNSTVASGSSRLSALSAGHRVRIEGSPFREANQVWFVTSVDHEVDDQGAYSNTFTAVPASAGYVPSRETPRPTVTSAFGLVTGPAGEEIHVDEYGRVEVALPWMAPGGDGLWMRVLQPNTDSLWLPRVGEEVLVAFEYGDADRPYVVGSAFNAQHMPPFALPQLKAVRRLGSRSSPGGNGVNEVFFGDVAGQELLRLGAAKDFRTVARNDHHSTVGNDLSTQVDADAQLMVGGNQQTTVAGQSLTRAGELVLQGTERIVLRVGSQQLVIDADGVQLPQSQATTSTNAPPPRLAPRETPGDLLQRRLK